MNHPAARRPPWRRGGDAEMEDDSIARQNRRASNARVPIDAGRWRSGFPVCPSSMGDGDFLGALPKNNVSKF